MHSRNRHHGAQLLFLTLAAVAALVFAFPPAARAQLPSAGQAPSATGTAPANAPAARSASPRVAQPNPPVPPAVKAITEEALRQQLAGKTFYLRGGFLENDLHFDERGRMTGSSPQGSYTLSMVEINRVHLSKHKLQLEGVRYGLHFLGAGSSEAGLPASDKVRITPKKKVLKIAIDRAEVITPKKKHKAAKSQPSSANSAAAMATAAAQQPLDPNQSLAQSAAAGNAAPLIPAEDGSILTQARANQFLKEALDRVFAQGLDNRMIAALPDFWKLYYQAAADRSNWPSDPSILRQNTVDQKARLLTNFEPPSNDFAQAAGVAGVALYHVIVSPDGKPAEIAVDRPIGFGLDENAVASIRKASFQPALKDGKPVPVLLDLLVQFRIFSKRTAVSAAEEANAAQAQPQAAPLPGPYTVNEPQAKPPQ